MQKNLKEHGQSTYYARQKIKDKEEYEKECEKTVIIIQTTLDEMRKCTAKVSKNREEIEEQCTRKRRHRDGLQGRRDEFFQDILEDIEADLEQLNNRLMEINGEYYKCQPSLETLQRELEKKERELTESRKEVDNLKMSMRELETTLHIEKVFQELQLRELLMTTTKQTQVCKSLFF